MSEAESSRRSWRERRKAAKREKAERTGDSPEKRAERKSNSPDVKDAVDGTAIRGTVVNPPGIGGF